MSTHVKPVLNVMRRELAGYGRQAVAGDERRRPEPGGRQPDRCRGRRAGVGRLLFLGSSCIYPRLAQQPMSGYDIKRFLKGLSWLIGSPSSGSSSRQSRKDHS